MNTNIEDFAREFAELRERVEILEQTHGAVRGLAEALLTGGRAQAERLPAEIRMAVVLYSLLATRIRAVEEEVYTPDRAAVAAEYWARALEAIGCKVDPLDLPK